MSKRNRGRKRGQPADPRKPHQRTGDGIWIRSEPTPDGSRYMASIEVGPDRSFYPADKMAYVLTVMTAIERAVYESAVMRQMCVVLHIDPASPTELQLLTMGEVLKQLRAAHKPLNDAATAPLTFTPVVAGDPTRNFAPSVHVALDGEPFCQWERGDVYSHIYGVLSVSTVAGLDTTYHEVVRNHWLGDDVEGVEWRARLVVQDVGRFRDPG